MKHIVILLSTLFCLLGLADSSRSWVLNNGYIFPASFEKFDAGNAVLKLESGKTQRVPVTNLGVADRYYLHTEHQIPIADLEGGNYLTAERDIRIDDSKFEKVSSIKLKGDGYEAELGAIITPHFAFFHDRGTKVSEYAEGLEKVIFSHAYRMPGYPEMIPKKRRTFIFIKDFGQFMDWVSLKAVKMRNAVELKKEALRETAGYLSDEDEDFINAVEEAGKSVPETHESPENGLSSCSPARRPVNSIKITRLPHLKPAKKQSANISTDELI